MTAVRTKSVKARQSNLQLVHNRDGSIKHRIALEPWIRGSISKELIDTANKIYLMPPMATEDRRYVFDWHWSARRWNPEVRIGLDTTLGQIDVLLQKPFLSEAFGNSSRNGGKEMLREIQEERSSIMMHLTGFVERITGISSSISVFECPVKKLLPQDSPHERRLDFRIHLRPSSAGNKAQSSIGQPPASRSHKIRGAILLPAGMTASSMSGVNTRLHPDLQTFKPQWHVLAGHASLQPNELLTLQRGDVVQTDLRVQADGGLRSWIELNGTGRHAEFSAFSDGLLYQGLTSFRPASRGYTSYDAYPNSSRPMLSSLQISIAQVALGLEELQSLTRGTSLGIAALSGPSAASLLWRGSTLARGEIIPLGNGIGFRIATNLCRGSM